MNPRAGNGIVLVDVAIGGNIRAAPRCLHSPRVPTVVQLPVLHGTAGDVAAAVARVTGRRAMIEWGDDAKLTRLFGAMPPLDARTSLKLGFRADENMDALARAALTGDPS
ncbi:hypothetical protein I6F26_11770 [Ensifer sp. IC3342]|nr:hypothetical protein [Ensifer sp. BRP08]MCA1447252.1 hypothetical protein [Ensifer sp. IC3342]